MGMLARVIAEGVSFGASSTSVSFDSGLAKGAAQPSSGSEFDPLSFMDDWSDSYKRLVFSTAALFLGFMLEWMHNYNGLDLLFAMGKQPWGDTVMITFYFEQINLKQGSVISNITGMLFYLLPWIFVATFGYAWYGHTQGNEEAASSAGNFHFGAVMLYAVLFVYETTQMDSEIWNWVSKGDYFVYDKLGTWVAGLSGLGLLFRMDRVDSGGNGSSRSRGATFEEIDTDGDGFGNNGDDDDDGDSVLDNSDAFPLDAGEWEDNDGDGIVDDVDTDDDWTSTVASRPTNRPPSGLETPSKRPSTKPLPIV